MTENKTTPFDLNYNITGGNTDDLLKTKVGLDTFAMFTFTINVTALVGALNAELRMLVSNDGENFSEVGTPVVIDKLGNNSYNIASGMGSGYAAFVFVKLRFIQNGATAGIIKKVIFNAKG